MLKTSSIEIKKTISHSRVKKNNNNWLELVSEKKRILLRKKKNLGGTRLN